MGFTEDLNNFSSRVDQLKDSVSTEEATKTSIVLPFFQLLGYDVFNPLEFVPEFTADAGIKKGEKVDYAILQKGNPVIIIEVKSANTNLSINHINQLFRYFSVTKAKFGILTNGIKYQFFSDLEEQNKMDFTPFMEVDLLDLKSDAIKSLAKFRKEAFAPKDILNKASDLKYIHLLKQAIADQFTAPSDQFVKALIKNIYSGTKTQNVIDKFKELTLVAMNEYTSDMLNEKLQNAMGGYHTQPIIQTQEKELDFLPFELQTMDYIRDSMHLSDLTYKKTTYYAYAYIRTQNRWVFRVSVQKNKNLFTLHKFEDTDYETEYYFDEPETLEQIRTLIEDTYKRCKNI